MFYNLYKDRDVSYGGLWYEPLSEDVIEVIDMSAHSKKEEGVNYIERGSAYITFDRLDKALRSEGYFTEEDPPKPPSGRKQWFHEDFVPPPKPGSLFWAPEPIIGPRILKSWEEWQAFKKVGAKFEEIPEEIRRDVLLAADAIVSYHGQDSVGVAVVIDQEKLTPFLKERYPSAVISSWPEKAIWKILKKMGVRP